MNPTIQITSSTVIPVYHKPKASKQKQRQGTSKRKRKQRAIGRYQYLLLCRKISPVGRVGYMLLVDAVTGELIKTVTVD